MYTAYLLNVYIKPEDRRFDPDGGEGDVARLFIAAVVQLL